MVVVLFIIAWYREIVTLNNIGSEMYILLGSIHKGIIRVFVHAWKYFVSYFLVE